MDSSQECTLRETARTHWSLSLSFLIIIIIIIIIIIHTGHNTTGSVRALVANQVTEFENSYFRTY